MTRLKTGFDLFEARAWKTVRFKTRTSTWIIRALLFIVLCGLTSASSNGDFDEELYKQQEQWLHGIVDQDSSCSRVRIIVEPKRGPNGKIIQYPKHYRYGDTGPCYTGSGLQQQKNAYMDRAPETQAITQKCDKRLFNEFRDEIKNSIEIQKEENKNAEADAKAKKEAYKPSMLDTLQATIQKCIEPTIDVQVESLPEVQIWRQIQRWVSTVSGKPNKKRAAAVLDYQNKLAINLKDWFKVKYGKKYFTGKLNPEHRMRMSLKVTKVLGKDAQQKFNGVGRYAHTPGLKQTYNEIQKCANGTGWWATGHAGNFTRMCTEWFRK